MTALRLLVCGGRDFKDEVFVFGALDRIKAKYGVALVIEGGQRGADALARKWADMAGIPCTTYKADWAKYGKRAGPFRNHFMIYDGKPDGVVAFPGGKGTANMIEQAEAAGIKVWEPAYRN